MPVQPSISVVMLTYQRPAELREALANLLAQMRLPDEIIVWDNDPAASGQAVVQAAGPLVHYYCPGENLGVTHGRNCAAAKATGNILLFLDDDVRLASETAIEEILAAFAEADIACLALLLRNAFTGKIVPKEYPGYSTRGWAAPHDVGYFLGGAVAIRRQVFLELDGYDAALFYGGEEAEFSLRVIEAGWRIHYLPIEVLHRVAAQGREAIRVNYRLFRNRAYVAVKHLPMPFLLSHLCVWGLYAFLQAMRARDLRSWAQGVTALWRDGLLNTALSYRRAHTLSRRTLRYLRRHEGRLWY